MKFIIFALENESSVFFDHNFAEAHFKLKEQLCLQNMGYIPLGSEAFRKHIALY